MAGVGFWAGFNERGILQRRNVVLITSAVVAVAFISANFARAADPAADASPKRSVFNANSQEWKALRTARRTATLQQLNSGDPAQIARAVSALRDASKNMTQGQDRPVQVLIEGKRFDDAAQLATEVIIARAADTYTAANTQKMRVQALLSAHKYSDALAAARSFYNIAKLKDSSDAIVLLARCLVLGKPDEAGAARRFKRQQIAWATVDPASQPATTQPSAMAHFSITDHVPFSFPDGISKGLVPCSDALPSS